MSPVNRDHSPLIPDAKLLSVTSTTATVARSELKAERGPARRGRWQARPRAMSLPSTLPGYAARSCFLGLRSLSPPRDENHGPAGREKTADPAPAAGPIVGRSHLRPAPPQARQPQHRGRGAQAFRRLGLATDIAEMPAPHTPQPPFSSTQRRARLCLSRVPPCSCRPQLPAERRGRDRKQQPRPPAGGSLPPRTSSCSRDRPAICFRATEEPLRSIERQPFTAAT